MMSGNFVCGDGPAIDYPDVGNTEVPCCWGSAEHGHTGCTCWTPVYDLAQADVQPGEAGIMGKACGDCAYRADSPERNQDPDVQGNPTLLEDLVESGQPFWCHDGMRQIVGYEHPTGAVFDVRRDIAYTPPMVNGTPYRADGTPGSMCAGWAARTRVRQAELARGEA